MSAQFQGRHRWPRVDSEEASDSIKVENKRITTNNSQLLNIGYVIVYLFVVLLLSGLGVIMEFIGRNVGPDQVCRRVCVRIHPVSKIKQE